MDFHGALGSTPRPVLECAISSRPTVTAEDSARCRCSRSREVKGIAVALAALAVLAALAALVALVVLVVLVVLAALAALATLIALIALALLVALDGRRGSVASAEVPHLASRRTRSRAGRGIAVCAKARRRELADYRRRWNNICAAERS